MNKQEKEELNERKKKAAETDAWIKTIALPLVVGFSLIYAVKMPLFKIIGWGLFLFGLLALLFYAFKHKEKIKKIKDEFLGALGKRPKEVKREGEG